MDIDQDELFTQADLDALVWELDEPERPKRRATRAKTWGTLRFTGQAHPLEDYPVGGKLEGGTPATVEWARGRGYQWPPFSEAQDFFQGASSIGAWQDSWDWWNEVKHARIATKYRHKLADFSRDDDAEAFIMDRIKNESKEDMKNGSMFHEWVALADAGLDAGTYPSRCDRGWAESWAMFKEQYGAEVLAVERTGYAPALKLAGTIDRIVRLHNPPKVKGLNLYPGCVVALDLKTTAKDPGDISPSKGYVWQITALAAATHVAIEEAAEVVQIPRLDGGVIVTVTPSSRPHVRFVDVHDPDLLAAIQAHAYARWVSAKMTNNHFGTVEIPRVKSEA